MKKHSEQTKQKIKNATQKYWNSTQGLLKKKRMSERGRKRKGITYQELYGDRSNEIKHKIGIKQKGIPKSEESKIKNRNSHLGKKRPSFSKEWIKNIGLAQKGEKGSNWQGGKSFELYGVDWTDELKESIRKRDNYICQECGIHQDELTGFSKKLDIHHIDYNKHNLNLNNLISLCRECHAKTNHKREYWINYFSDN